MLDINFVELRAGFLQYLPIGGLIGLILLVELVLVVATWAIGPDAGTLAAPQAKLGALSNTEQIGTLLYTRYIYLFQAAGMVLLIAMIGAIVLTLRSREGVRRQKIARQISRKVEDTVELKKVPTRSGV
jgi:NADH-quinone oxidoreductase subunit J